MNNLSLTTFKALTHKEIRMMCRENLAKMGVKTGNCPKGYEEYDCKCYKVSETRFWWSVATWLLCSKFNNSHSGRWSRFENVQRSPGLLCSRRRHPCYAQNRPTTGFHWNSDAAISLRDFLDRFGRPRDWKSAQVGRRNTTRLCKWCL